MKKLFLLLSIIFVTVHCFAHKKNKVSYTLTKVEANYKTPTGPKVLVDWIRDGIQSKRVTRLISGAESVSKTHYAISFSGNKKITKKINGTSNIKQEVQIEKTKETTRQVKNEAVAIDTAKKNEATTVNQSEAKNTIDVFNKTIVSNYFKTDYEFVLSNYPVENNQKLKSLSESELSSKVLSIKLAIDKGEKFLSANAKANNPLSPKEHVLQMQGVLPLYGNKDPILIGVHKIYILIIENDSGIWVIHYDPERI